VTASLLARSYLEKASKRLKALAVLLQERAYSDVIREAQEIVELAQKAMLREIGVEPPKFHDVGPFLLDHAGRLPEEVQPSLKKVAEISGWLRKEREFSFYGDIDFIPTERYTREEAEKAIADAEYVVKIAARVVREK